MTINEVTLDRPEVFSGFCVLFCFAYWLRLLRISLEAFSRIFTPYRLGPPWSGFSDSVVSSKQLCCSICYWDGIFTIVRALSTLHGVSEYGFLTRPKFTIPQCLRPKSLLSKFHPRKNASEKYSRLDDSCDVDVVDELLTSELGTNLKRSHF